MRIVVTAGHNVYLDGLFDPGAVNQPFVEAAITKSTVTKLINYLRGQGHMVLDATPYNEEFVTSGGVSAKKKHHIKRCKAVDNFNADIYLDIHINAGGGTGVECWVHNMGSKSIPYAREICKSISSNIGIPNRGVKVKPAFWSVSLTSKPAIIIEGGFIDSSDMEKLNATNYAESIAKVFGSVNASNNSKPIPPKSNTNDLYRVRKSWGDFASQIGAFRDLNNAIKMVDDNKGYKVFNSKGNQVYPKESTSSQTWRKYINGQEVKNLQIELNKQFNKGVKVDGYFGLEMERKCNVNVRKGAKGNLTKIIQKRLQAKGYKPNNGIDGSFGPSTHQKVVQFQRSRKILDNGIVGKYTWRELFKK